jgi:hypothetical protein
MSAPENVKHPQYVLKTTAEYAASPFPWGGVNSSIKFVGVKEQRETLLNRLAQALSGINWFDRDQVWPDPAKELYAILLGIYYSIDAKRVLALVNGISIEGGTSETLTKACVDGQVPLTVPSITRWDRILHNG